MATPKFNISASAKELLRDVALVLSALNAQVDRLYRVKEDLATLYGARPADTVGAIVSATLPTAYDIHYYPREDGYIEFSIDGGKRVALPPRLGELFRLIADHDQTGKDGLVAWRPREELIGLLGTTGERPTKNYLNNMVYLLRKRLQIGYPRALVQTSRQGIRFALKVHPKP